MMTPRISAKLANVLRLFITKTTFSKFVQVYSHKAANLEFDQTCWSRHFPFLNTYTAIAVSTVSENTIATNTPFGPKPADVASQYASGI